MTFFLDKKVLTIHLLTLHFINKAWKKECRPVSPGTEQRGMSGTELTPDPLSCDSLLNEDFYLLTIHFHQGKFCVSPVYRYIEPNITDK